MGRPPGIPNKPKPPAEGAAVMAPPAINPVRPQVRELSGYSSIADLKDALPDSTAVGAAEVKQRKTRTPKTVDVIDDPYYEKCVAGMVGGGGQRIIKSGFKVAAIVTENPEVGLDNDEEEKWKEFFYVVGKKVKFNPDNPWALGLYGAGLLGEHILIRVWKLNSASFTNSIMNMFGLGHDEEPEAKGKDESGEAEE